ncbi:aldehyde dehydrogenase family protein [Magnetovibrio sp. PR-2]|uniref:aldehyde dehydrogenase family protein n=1 Tax=Magnetovibrio sp. PR-2 TaxID=3120356 RepID=UPI002FCE2B3A
MKMLLAGDWVSTQDKDDITCPFDGEVIGDVPKAGPADVDKAFEYAGTYDYALTPWERYTVLSKLAERLDELRDEIAELICKESGKTIRDAQIELSRSITTFRVSAEEAKRITGEVVPVAAVEGAPDTLAFTVHEPIGTVVAITPFNYPLNLVAHKVGPALAANNPVILKPSNHTPLTALRLGELLLECGLPPQMFQVLTGDPLVLGPKLISHKGIAKITFTGSIEVGKTICAQSGMIEKCMELGGNDPLIVLQDADLRKVIPIAIDGAFGNNGQRCTSIKRIIVQGEIADEFVKQFVESASKLKIGHPLDPSTDIGPLINESAAEKVEQAIQAGIRDGAELKLGGKRDGAVIEPTILDYVSSTNELVQHEVFGPVAPIIRVADFEGAIAVANGTQYGLQAGIFSNDMEKIMRAAKTLETGAVMVNKAPGFRAEHLPFGGTKDSGLGREGVKYAVRSMTKIKTVVL